MQFLASISLDLTRRSGVERALAAETARVRELMQSGRMHWLYIPEGTGAPGSLWGVFNGDARENVERILESLPPVAIGTTDTVFLIPLTFGARSDWCRNVL